MSKTLFSKLLLAACVLSLDLEAATRLVNSTSNDPNVIGTLPYWLINGSSGDVLDCSLIAGQNITLTSSLPAITKSCTINGAGVTIDGAGSYQAFQVAYGNVSIHNIQVQNAISKGGDGGDGYSGGGGGVGGGGALYVHGGTTVTMTASSLINNVAQGGDGGAANNNGNAGAGGGGGFGGGNGGSALTIVSTGGGGGGHSNGGNGGSQSSVNGSNGVYFGGGGGGAGINSVAPGGTGGNATIFTGGAQSSGNGGGGAGAIQDGFSATGSGGSGVPGNGGSGIGVDLLYGGGGGGGAASETGFPGGTGIGAAGGGGGSNYAGGPGGVLGGGGGGGLGGNGGQGGFGAGGGGAAIGGLGGDAGGGTGASNPSAVGGGGGGSGLGGAIFVQSNGTLNIVDAPLISGNTAIGGIGGSSTNSGDAGYIAPGNGAALGADIFIREQGTLTFDMSNSLTIATPIEGNGSGVVGGLYKLGAGTLKLNGANTYSGITSVNNGTLNLNGSVIGNTIVGPGGFLSGNATILGDLTSSGTISPGNSIGTINTTNLLLTPSSIVEIEVASDGTNDLIAATGTATIDGALAVIPLPGSYEGVDSYTIITAEGGRTGTFTSVTSSEPSLVGVTYEPNAVILEVLPVSAIGLGSNAEAAASCYLTDPLIPGSDRETVSAALLTLSIDELNSSFNQMQPSQFSGLAWSQIENALMVRSSYLQHLELNLCTPHLWGEILGAWQQQNSNGEQFGYTAGTGGITLGMDVGSFNDIRFGAAASYTYTDLDWKKSAGNAHINSYYGGLYGSWSDDCVYLNVTALGAYSHYKATRHLHFASIDRHARSSHNSWEALVGFEAGYNLGFDITPFARFDYIYLSRQGFTESGADSLNLNVSRHQDQVIQSELGVIWTTNYDYCNGTLIPRIKLSYMNDAPINSRYLNASFVDSTCVFTVKGLDFCRNLGVVSLGSTYLNCDETMALTFRYDGQFGNNYFNQAANLALEVNF